MSALLGASLSATSVSALLSGCGAPSADYAPRTLDQKALAFVTEVADVIIPTTDTPGARDARVGSFIDMMLAEYYSPDERAAFIAGMAAFNDRLETHLEWTSLTAAEREEALASIDHAAYRRPAPTRTEGEPFTEDGWYRRLKELVVVGYYTSEVGGTQELSPMPMGPFQADVPLGDGRSWL